MIEVGQVKVTKEYLEEKISEVRVSVHYCMECQSCRYRTGQLEKSRWDTLELLFKSATTEDQVSVHHLQELTVTKAFSKSVSEEARAEGNTVLHRATYMGSVELAQKLIEIDRDRPLRRDVSLAKAENLVSRPHVCIDDT